MPSALLHPARPQKALAFAVLLAALQTASCARAAHGHSSETVGSKAPFEIMSLSWQKELAFQDEFFRSFGQHHNVETRFIPNARLSLYKSLLSAHSQQPDLLEIDIVWPAMLKDDLVDLRPYFKDRLQDFEPGVLNSYIVDGKLLAVPLFIDVGVLYYRTDLLQKYGFQSPPRTWDELERMATVIQRGERSTGHPEFWSFVWQGSASEGGTCNALEWQASAGAGNFVEDGGRANVNNALFVEELRRRKHWLGTISPPAAYAYWEDDALNLWREGETAFMRNWTSAYSTIAERAESTHRPFAVAPLPGGQGGRRGTLGGLGLSISRYAAHRELAIQALLELTSYRTSLRRLLMTNSIPVLTALGQQARLTSRTPLLAIAPELMRGLVLRPTVATGGRYGQVSAEYAKTVSAILSGKQTPEDGVAALQTTLSRIVTPLRTWPQTVNLTAAAR